MNLLFFFFFPQLNVRESEIWREEKNRSVAFNDKRIVEYYHRTNFDRRNWIDSICNIDFDIDRDYPLVNKLSQLNRSRKKTNYLFFLSTNFQLTKINCKIHCKTETNFFITIRNKSKNNCITTSRLNKQTNN